MFGFLPTPPPIAVAAGGAVLFILTVAQMLIGYRKIKFKGRTHMKVHKTLAWVLLVGGLGHAFAATLYLGILN